MFLSPLKSISFKPYWPLFIYHVTQIHNCINIPRRFDLYSIEQDFIWPSHSRSGAQVQVRSQVSGDVQVNSHIMKRKMVENFFLCSYYCGPLRYLVIPGKLTGTKDCAVSVVLRNTAQEIVCLHVCETCKQLQAARSDVYTSLQSFSFMHL